MEKPNPNPFRIQIQIHSRELKWARRGDFSGFSKFPPKFSGFSPKISTDSEHTVRTLIFPEFRGLFSKFAKFRSKFAKFSHRVLTIFFFSSVLSSCWGRPCWPAAPSPSSPFRSFRLFELPTRAVTGICSGKAMLPFRSQQTSRCR